MPMKHKWVHLLNSGDHPNQSHTIRPWIFFVLRLGESSAHEAPWLQQYFLFVSQPDAISSLLVIEEQHNALLSVAEGGDPVLPFPIF